MLTYTKLSGIRTGLLLNFNSAALKDGIRRLGLWVAILTASLSHW